MSQTHDPGWYDDGQGRKRWWDGTRWGPLADAIEQAATSQSSVSDAARAAVAEARESLTTMAREELAERVPMLERTPDAASRATSDAAASAPVPSATNRQPPVAATSGSSKTRASGQNSRRPSSTPQKKGVAVAILALIAGVVSLLISFLPLIGALAGSIAVIIALIALIRQQPKVISYAAIVMGTIAVFISLGIAYAVWSAVG